MVALSKPIDVLLFDPVRQIFNEDLQRLMARDKSIDRFHVCFDYDRVEGETEKLQPDIFLLAPQLPGTEEYHLVNGLRKISSSPTVAMSCPSTSDEYLLLAVSLGADVCITYDMSPLSLLQTVLLACNGPVPMEQNALKRVDLAPQIEARLQNTPPVSAPGGNANPLTRRERELLQVVSKGCSNQDVGRLLHIQEQTVKNHVSSILRKTRARDRYQAAVNALRNGWISLT
jgi:two-component system nitrate/nitrite response regulator NarL